MTRAAHAKTVVARRVRSYISIPQRTRNTQKLAINSLASYASIADAFVIVAPTVTHEDTGLVCNVATYNRRMWHAPCRAVGPSARR
jgi:hypothetical protein